MAVTHNIMDYIQLYEAVQATGTFDSVASAIQSGAVQQSGNAVITAFSSIAGGKGMPVISYDDALQVAKTAETLGASAAAVYTAAGTVLRNTATGIVKAAGTLTMTVPEAAAAAAPLAGVALGAGLYEANPNLWTKISKTLLPFCYDEGKLQAFCDFVVDAETAIVKPVVLLPMAIVDALKQLFQDEEVSFVETVSKTDSLGRTVSGFSATACGEMIYPGAELVSVTGNPMAYPTSPTAAYIDGGTVVFRNPNSSYTTLVGGSEYAYPGFNFGEQPYPASVIKSIVNDPDIEPQYFPPTAGVSAPSTPVEPIVWPDTPIIIVPDPLGPDYQPIPVTPVTPILPPAPETPLLPEHVPDPTPEEKPEEWPEEEPWPTVIPFPIQPTEPTPDWPEVMPWPLPSEQPDEWPVIPKEWPYPFPEELPWPATPNQWPEEVPWPETSPDWWPEEIPWPETPEDWPEEVPWPVPWPEDWPLYPPSWPEPFPPELPWPSSPEDWPTEVPWPETPPEWWPDETPWPASPDQWPEPIPWPMPPSWPIKWPPDLPYPWPFPYPLPSPDPYPDPENPEDPEQRVDPIIDPWPYPWPDPYPDPKPSPDPYRDPTQPDPRPVPEPQPEPEPEPPNPYPTPPEGTINPPPVPIIPLPFSTTTGLISVYHPTQSELLSFAQWLWVTWQDATIDKIWNNPFDGVITLFELYCTPTDVGRKNIRSGFLDSGVSSQTISRYTELDCGSIGVPEFYGNYFDYAPYSKCHIFLPFIGIVELNVDDVVGHGVNVTYRIDEYNGSCIAMITCAKSTEVNGVSVDYSTIVYQFSGNCAVELPIAGGSQAAIKAGMIEAAAWGLGSVIGGVMGGSSLGQIGQGLAYGAASAVHSVVSAKSSVQHSGSFGSSYGAMGGKVPYIIVTRPKQIQVPNYNELYGYQAHKMVRVGDCSGYLRCREVHVISPTASDEEKSLIEQLMKMGVYVTE